MIIVMSTCTCTLVIQTSTLMITQYKSRVVGPRIKVFTIYKVQVGNDQEKKVQSEKDSLSKNRGGKMN